ncbi:MAG: hypothetical protein GY715_03455 [Planctomycetes bacterium]|nr:hypothetical protein [Planctomycetota bacterium]
MSFAHVVAVSLALATAASVATEDTAEVVTARVPQEGPTSRPERRRRATSGVRSPAAILAGPTVEAEAIDRAAPRRTDRARRSIPPRRWLEEFRRIDLDAEQKSRSRAILAELNTARRAFESEHGKKVRALRKTARGDRESRRKLQEIEAEAPKVRSFQMRLWRLLRPDQQDQLRLAFAEIRRAAARRRERDEKTKD